MDERPMIPAYIDGVAFDIAYRMNVKHLCTTVKSKEEDGQRHTGEDANKKRDKGKKEEPERTKGGNKGGSLLKPSTKDKRKGIMMEESMVVEPKLSGKERRLNGEGEDDEEVDYSGDDIMDEGWMFDVAGEWDTLGQEQRTPVLNGWTSASKEGSQGPFNENQKLRDGRHVEDADSRKIAGVEFEEERVNNKQSDLQKETLDGRDGVNIVPATQFEQGGDVLKEENSNIGREILKVSNTQMGQYNAGHKGTCSHMGPCVSEGPYDIISLGGELDQQANEVNTMGLLEPFLQEKALEVLYPMMGSMLTNKNLATLVLTNCIEAGILPSTILNNLAQGAETERARPKATVTEIEDDGLVAEVITQLQEPMEVDGREDNREVLGQLEMGSEQMMEAMIGGGQSTERGHREEGELSSQQERGARKRRKAPAVKRPQSVRRSARVNTGEQPLSSKEKAEQRAKIRALELGEGSRSTAKNKGKEIAVMGARKPRNLGSVQVAADFTAVPDRELLDIAATGGFHCDEEDEDMVVGEMRTMMKGGEDRE